MTLEECFQAGGDFLERVLRCCEVVIHQCKKIITTIQSNPPLMNITECNKCYSLTFVDSF